MKLQKLSAYRFQICLFYLLVILSLYMWDRHLSGFTEKTIKKYRPTNMQIPKKVHLNQECTPVKQIVFVKTHKTGSTTTGTMFERYGEKKSLIFALPREGHMFTTTELFNRSMPLKLKQNISLNGRQIKNKYNILTNHARYNRAEMDAVVPNAKYVTILREPSAQLESTFAYFNLAKGWGLEDTPNALEMFMKDPKLYFDQPLFKSYLASNGQLFDLGLDHRFHSDQFILDYKIRQLENEFDLVMIVEYYDESLILLKQTLCLDYEDIIYFKKGERNDSNRYKITTQLRKKMLSWNKYDVKLYKHFNKTFWKKVNANREQFDKELFFFRQFQDDVTEKCVEEVIVDGVSKRKIPSNLPKEDVEFCKRIYMGDGRFVKGLRQRYIHLGFVEPDSLPTAQI